MIAQDISDLPITVIDTKNIGIAAGLIVIEAVRLIEAGVLLKNLSKNLWQRHRKLAYSSPSPPSIFLRKGGRISEAVYRMALY